MGSGAETEERRERGREGRRQPCCCCCCCCCCSVVSPCLACVLSSRLCFLAIHSSPYSLQYILYSLLGLESPIAAEPGTGIGRNRVFFTFPCLAGCLFACFLACLLPSWFCLAPCRRVHVSAFVRVCVFVCLLRVCLRAFISKADSFLLPLLPSSSGVQHM